MRTAVRPYVTAGVAMVGASVIAVTPITTPLPDIQVHNPNLQLTSLATDIQAYVAVFQQAASNGQALLSTFLANPTPILSQIIKNQIAAFQALVPALQDALTTTAIPALQAALADLTSGNVQRAVNNVLTAALSLLLPLGNLVTQPLTNLGKAINIFAGNFELVLLPGLIGPLISGVGATGTAIQDVIDAVPNGPLAVLDALITGPAVILDGVLNGPTGALLPTPGGAPGYGPNLASLVGLPGLNVFGPGLLTPPIGFVLPNSIIPGGPIGAVQSLQEAIAKAIDPPAAPAPVAATSLARTAAPASTVPNLSTTTVTLNTKPTQGLAPTTSGPTVGALRKAPGAPGVSTVSKVGGSGHHGK